MPSKVQAIEDIVKNRQVLDRWVKGIIQDIGGKYIPKGTTEKFRDLRPFIKESPREIADTVIKDIPGSTIASKGWGTLMKALTLGGGITLGGLGIGEGISALKSKTKDLFKEKAFDEMINVSPKLRLEDPERVRLYFDTLWKFGPDLAKDPLTAGSVIHQAMSMDLGAGPPIDQIKTVVDIQHRREQKQQGTGSLSDFLSEAGKKQVVGLYD